jgi:hypothetical protein
MNQNAAKSNVLPFPQPDYLSDIPGSPEPGHLSDIKNLTATGLRKKYIKTSGSHKNMKSRVKDGYIVHPEIAAFTDFLRLMGPNPTDLGATENYTLDRINPYDKEYAVKKLRWATKQTQANNKTNTTLYTHNGVTLNLTEWGKKLGVSRQTLTNRLKKGLPPYLVFIKKLPKQTEVKVFKGWGQIPLQSNTNIEKLEKLYCVDNKFRGSTLTRIQWLFFHFVTYTLETSLDVAENWNPYTEGFDTEKYEILNNTLDKATLIVEKLDQLLDPSVSAILRRLARDYPRSRTYEVLKAYTGQNN